MHWSFAFCLVLAASTAAFTVEQDTYSTLNNEDARIQVGAETVTGRAVIKKDLSKLNATEQQHAENIANTISKVDLAYTTTELTPEGDIEIAAAVETHKTLEDKNKTNIGAVIKPIACESDGTKQEHTNRRQSFIEKPKFHAGAKVQIIVPTKYPYTTREPEHYHTKQEGDHDYHVRQYGSGAYPGYGGYPGYGFYPGYPGVSGYPGFAGYPFFNGFNGFNSAFPFFVPVGTFPNGQATPFFNPFIPGFQNRNFGTKSAKATRKTESSTEAPIAATTESVKVVVKEKEPIPAFLRLFG